MNTNLVMGVFVCGLFMYTSALQCNTGVEGAGKVRKVTYNSLFMCCYKYTDVVFKKYTFFGALPPGLTKQMCSQVGKCFYSKILNKNVCVCANADDPNCQPDGPVSITTKTTPAPTTSSTTASTTRSTAASTTSSTSASTASSSAASTTRSTTASTTSSTTASTTSSTAASTTSTTAASTTRSTTALTTKSHSSSEQSKERIV